MADLNHAVQVSAGADVVYNLVATAAGLTRWWAADVTEQNGAVSLGFFNRCSFKTEWPSPLQLVAISGRPRRRMLVDMMQS